MHNFLACTTQEKSYIYFFKWYLKKKTFFTQPHVIPNLYDSLTWIRTDMNKNILKTPKYQKFSILFF